MPLSEPSERREKILLCAGAKTGKSTAMLSVAFWSWKSGDPRKFYIVDFDDAIPDLLLDPKYEGMDNYELMSVGPDWEEWLTTSDEVTQKAQKGDWIFFDMVDRGWRTVQEWYSLTVNKQSRAQMLLSAAKEGKTGWDLSRGIEWSVVNAQWDAFIKPPLLASKAHLFFTSEITDLGSDGGTADQKKDRREFGRYKPAGQKNLPYQVRSILRMERLARGRVLYTLGDRARKELNGDEMTDFFQVYLKGVAGWGIQSGGANESGSS